MSKRFLAIFLSLAMVFTMSPMGVVYANESNVSTDVDSGDVILENDDMGQPLQPNGIKQGEQSEGGNFRSTQVTGEVYSSDELSAALEAGLSEIKIASDFSLNQTYYVTSNVTIYSDEVHILTRSPEFYGDLFVIGTDKNGNSSADITVNFGKATESSSALLIIDGNSKNSQIAGAVTGSAIYNNNNGTLNLRADIKLTNHEKVAGATATESGYGAAVYNLGVLNVFGGQYETNTAVKGGVIYNAGTAQISGSTFRNNKSIEEGGAIYGAADATAEITNTTFTGNSTESVESGNGGALSVHSNNVMIENSDFAQNHSAKSGGAIYVSYASSSAVNSSVSVIGTMFTENISDHHGGAVYVTADNTKGNNSVLTLKDSEITSNTSSFNGGGVYITAATTNINNSNFSKNKAEATANESGSRYGGGALYFSGSITDITGGSFTENESNYNAGAIALYSDSNVTIDGISASDNTAANAGGAIYNSGSTLHVSNSTLSSNISEAGGGAGAFYSEAVTTFESTQFKSNTAHTNGGALFIYTGATNTSVKDSDFVDNEAIQFGGGIYISKASILDLESVTAEKNKAESGGFLYETTTATQVTIKGLTVNQNSASSGSIIYGNTVKAILNIDKSKYVDLETDILDEAYWTAAIANKLTVNEIHDEEPIDDPEDPDDEVSDHVKSASQLEKALNNNLDTIIIDDDFEIDRTLYISDSTTIKTETSHTLTRSASFTGDLFVVGEKSNGEDGAKDLVFSFGSTKDSEGILTIDGNTDNMQNSVNGSVLFISNNAKVKLNKGITIQNATKSGNSRALSDKYNLGTASHIGGAVAIVSDGRLDIIGGEYCNNTASGTYYGGVVYNASTVNIRGGSFHDNEASRGGVVANIRGNSDIRNADFINNTANDEGGAIYNAADCEVTIVNAAFTENSTTSADDGGGGAVSVHSNVVNINGGIFSRNSSAHAGGALYISYASSSGVNSDVSITDSLFEENTAIHFGGAVYATGKAVENSDTVLNIDSTTFKSNTSVKGGGAVTSYSNAKTAITTSAFESNSTDGNGGALYFYTGACDNSVNDTTFNENSAAGYGGAIYISNASKLNLYSDKALNNSAKNGGYIYITTTATEVTMIRQTVSGNTASVAGPIIYGNTTKSILNINKSNYIDLEQDILDNAYWASAIANKITINDISDDVPSESQEEIVIIKDPVDVASADELENAIDNKAPFIRITNDFELDRTFYITGKTLIYSTRAHTLTRASDFAGDIFVVGEDKNGRNLILDNTNAVLTLGKPGSKVDDLLVIDGNKDHMAVDVTGSVLFICYSGKANLYDNFSVINSRKSGNSKSLNSKYNLPYPERIGGSVAIVANGTLNVMGGKFSDNEVNEEAAVLTEDDPRISTIGGAIFNYSNLNIYGGEFNGNSAGRGGAIYNYRMANFYKGIFDGNKASKYGGAVYQAESQFGELLLGKTSDINRHEVVFRDNTAGNSGGALYSQTKNAIIIYGNTVFEGNKAINYNGGAINISGTLTIKGAEFINNFAKSKGGAFYIVNDDETLTTRIIKTENSLFTGNSAERGGAIGIMAAEDTYKEGGIAIFNNCTFSGNQAIDTSGNGTPGDMQGGAIYIIRKSKLTVNNSSFIENSAIDEGGAIYASGESTINLSNNEFSLNNTVSSDTGNGGAISVHSSELTSVNSTYENNMAARSAGAIYISYVGASEKDSVVNLNGDSFNNNDSKYHGGAIYVTTHIDNYTELPLTAKGTTFTKNHSSFNGGAIYFTGAQAYLNDVEFTQNVADATANSSGSRYGGGALYLTGSTVEINKATISGNTSDYNGGAIALYSVSNLIGNDIRGNDNKAVNFGGAIYSNKSTLNLYHSELSNNNSDKGGGAITLYTDANSNIYSSKFTGNSAVGNGGALYVYTGSTDSMVRDCEFENNTATSYGGAVYCSNGSLLSMFNNMANDNTANNGGVLYITSGGTTVNLAGLTVSGNNANDTGSIIYGNSAKAVLNIDKTKYYDLDSENMDATYWANAIAGKLTVNETGISIPGYVDYEHNDPAVIDPNPKDPVPVNDVFELEKITEDHSINTTYDRFAELDPDSNFMSRQETEYDDINGKRVTVDTFVYHPNVPAGNPSFGEGMLIYQAMLYKKAHPDEDVSIDISSFRFSVEAAVCINRNSKYFGYMRNLGKSDYDENGFVRIAYLLISAAKMGIHVNVIGQMDAYPVTSGAPNFKKYFSSQLNDPCDPAYVENGIISDYLNFVFVDWTSYGDDGASDMMHTKVCAVSNYIDKDGVEHSGTVWSSSANLDGINSNGTNGNNGVQTGTIISDHDQIYRVTSNYLKLIAQYGGQEDVYEFRDLVGKITTDQVQLINNGKENEIEQNKQIVYLGSESDSVFELYFSPFGGSAASWDENNNPFCKYLRKLEQSDDYILFSWSNVKFNKNFSLCTTMEDMIIQAFHKNKNVNNRIYILLPSFNSSAFNDLKVGEDIGYKSFGSAAYGTVHSKDLQFSYSENGKREYVSLLNSMNIHQGAMSYQSNFALVIKEDNCAEDSVFFTLADLTTSGIVDHNYGEEKRFEPEGKNEGYKYVECQECGKIVKTGVIHNDSGDWIIDREATETQKGLKHRECVACGEILEIQEIEIIGQQAIDINKKSDQGLTVAANTELYNLPEVIEDVPLTYEAELYVPKDVNGRAGVIIGNYAGSDVNSVSFEVYSNGHPRIYYRDADNNKSYSYVFNYDVRTGKKTHMAIALDGTKALLYINGKLEETKTIYSGLPKLSTELSVGGDSRDGNGQYFKGTIYSVNVFADVRTAEEIKKDMAYVASDTDQLVYSKYFTEDTCPKNSAGHIRSGWIVDYETTEEANGISHIECTNCGKILEVAEITSAGETARTLSYTAAKGLKITSSETKYVLPEVIEDIPLTFEAEIYVPKNVSDRAGIIVGNYNGPNVNSVSFEIKTNGRPRIYYRDAVNQKSYSYTFSNDIRTGKKVHIAIKLDGSKAILYIDGKRTATKDIEPNLPKLDTPLYVGSDPREGNEHYFKGTIYSINVFSDLRTDDEISRDAYMVSSSADSLLYSKYFTGDICTAGKDETTPHAESEWIVDEEPTATDKGTKHIECTVCGEILEISEIPALDYIGSHLDYNNASGLDISSAEDKYPLETFASAPKTIEADVYLPTSFSSSSRGGVILGSYSGKDKEMSFEIYTSGKPRLYIHNGSEYSYVFNTDIRSDVKRHLAITVDEGEAKLYINGVLKETIVVDSEIPNSTSTTYIGGDGRSGNGQYFKGKIYSMHVFDDVRTAEEIVMDRIYVPVTEEGLMYGQYYTGE